MPSGSIGSAAPLGRRRRDEAGIARERHGCGSDDERERNNRSDTRGPCERGIHGTR